MKIFLKNKKTKGFTLIETIVFISAFTVIVSALVSAIIYFYKSNTYVIEQSFALNNIRKGIETTSKYIKEATYSEEGSYPVISIGYYNMSFYSDIDFDGQVEKVRLFLDNGILKRGVTKATGVPLSYTGSDEIVSSLSSNVKNKIKGISIFRYYKGDGTEITNYGDVKDVAFVKLNLIVNIKPSEPLSNFTLDSSATLRNLKTNL